MTTDTLTTLLARARECLGRADTAGAITMAEAAVALASPGRDQIVARRTLGDAQLLSGDRLTARQTFVRALDEVHEHFDDDDVEALLLHNCIGVTAKFTGEVELAACHYERALEILRSRGGDDLMLAGLHHNLGGLAHTRGDMATAEMHTREALMLHEGVDEAGAAADRGQLGSILSERGQHEEALALIRRTIDDFAALLGAAHVEVAIAQTTLGAALHRSGDLEGAAQAYAEGLASRQRALGADHPELAPTLLNLGRLAADQNDPETARIWACRAVTVLEGNVVSDHPFLRIARERAGS